MRTLLVILPIAALSMMVGWIGALSMRSSMSSPLRADAEGTRKILFYQSPMHPWVKSDKPGQCTVCGMALVPVFEGAKGVDLGASASSDIVMLPQGAPNVTGVSTSEVKRERLIRTLRVAGLIEGDDSKNRVLSATTQGRIDRLFVNYEGAEVTEGQPLASFFSRPLLGAASEYKLSLKQGGAVLEAARNRLMQFGLSEAQIEAIPQRRDDDIHFELSAPATGTVIKRHVYEGQSVMEGESLFEIADFSTMWFQFIAYEQDLPFVALGQKVEITVPALPGRTFSAVVKFINPNLDDMTRSARVRVEVENPERLLRRKLYAQAIVALEAPEVITVPRTAVLWPGKSPRAYIEKATGAYQYCALKLGRAGDDAWEVMEGLREGDRVVTSGNMLIDGQAQLNNNMALPTDAPSGPGKPVTPELKAYLSAVTAITDALANDNLKGYLAAVKKLPTAPAGLPVKSMLGANAADLLSARKAFLPFSQEVAALALPMVGKVPDLKVFLCPMTDELWKGAPNNAKWVQLSDAIHNPYWGREMLDCGEAAK
ncbi:MAG: hypothetical protein JWO94_2084 [Verrucomicrobiaceae bacterium]|nr:hypothetical protein [Verrucomicrobiaceae bacterium]